ncbi:MAG: DUF1214 domain-containing protein [Deltaproteobacteria bacterium]|nr:DUF1214 domain-containing protein [Deltaproteobacteria bacterium]MBN2671636.1 DUF1214 domain-containing protein [Deltaproteobacteria bacterium]
MRRIVIALARGYKKIRLLLLKLRGRTPASHAAIRVATGQTWEDFCDTLKAAGANILAHPDVDERTQAEGYRYLSRLTRAGLEAFVEFADPKAPVLKRMVHETVKMGADNPDNYYQNAVISGEYDYRITGTRGSVHFLYLSTQKGGYGQGGNMPPTGSLSSKEIIVDEAGRVEIILSCNRQPGNWLPMEKDTGLVMVRQTFLDKETETPAELHIERIHGDGLPTNLTALSLDEKLMNAANLVAGATFLFSKWTKDFQKHTNRLPQFDPDTSTGAGGDPDIAYFHSYWELDPHEALVIDAMPPDCEHWNFQLNNHWMESLDYRYYRIHINKHSAVYNDDGSVRVIVAHEDPGHPNWLSTTGHTRGTMCWRWIHANAHPEPQTRVLSLDALKNEAEQ